MNKSKSFSSLAFILFIVIYLIQRLKPERTYFYENSHDKKNLFIGGINTIVSIVTEKNTDNIWKKSEENNFGILYKLKLKPFTKIVLSFLLIDLWLYWWHRMNHESSFLWKFHKKHHEDEMLNSTTAIRFHQNEIFISLILRLFVFITLGISRKNFNFYNNIFFPIITFTHSNIKINAKFDNIIRKVVVTPEMHRIHHSKNMIESNSNYSSILSIWDRIFKTYVEKSKSEIKFGIKE